MKWRSDWASPEVSCTNWFSVFRRTQQTSSLLPHKRGLKPHAVLLSPVIDDLITKAINEFYLPTRQPGDAQGGGSPLMGGAGPDPM